jgi:hypothetical protein
MEENILPKIISEIENHFHFLFERGFKIQSKMYSPEAFGDWDIVLASPNCQIRIGTERQEVQLGFLPSKATSNFAISIEATILFLSNGVQYIGIYKGNLLDREKQLKRYADLLERYLDQILPLFGDDHEKYREDLLNAQKKINDMYADELRQKHDEIIRRADARRSALGDSLRHQKPDA